MSSGKVYLVGAGPGDPGLITLRAVEVLQRADVVLYDYLVNPVLLRHCRSNANLISLGKHGTGGPGRVLNQAQINEQLVSLAQHNRHIVRLKSGDPLIFARAGEELECLTQHGIPFEIVPGVTSGLAAASYAGIPFTHRDNASAVALVTGHEDADKTTSNLDFQGLARFPGTLVLYMGVTTVRDWSHSLIEAGKSRQTPVAILRRVSFPDQQRFDTTLGEVEGFVQQHRLRPPVVFVIGEVVAQGQEWNWFERRPLCGQTILVTRPDQQCAELTGPLQELGARVLLHPVINIRGMADHSAMDAAIERLDRTDWVVFSSANGVQHFFARLAALARDARAFHQARIAAIGPATAAMLQHYQVRADLVPDEYRAESLAEGLGSVAQGQRFLLVRASRGREVLNEMLTAAGGTVEQVVCYESSDVMEADEGIASQIAAGGVDWITVTSSAIASGLVRLFGAALHKSKLASISPVTSATLRQLGYEPAAEAAEYTIAGLVAAVARANDQGR